MQYKHLGRTGLIVSVICLGTGEYGNQVSEKEAARIMAGALANGVNFFDTSDSYAEGRSEEIIGRALKGQRHSVVLATKISLRTGPGPNDVGLSRKHIMKGIEDSLRRLQTDYIDLYYVHSPDPDTPIQETLRALDDLVHQGKVLYIGCDDFRAWQLCKALWVSDHDKLTRFDAIELPYNLLTRDIETELLPLLAQGLTLREAAARMAIGYKTADSYRTSLLRKLGVRDRVELARYAIRERIIEP